MTIIKGLLGRLRFYTAEQRPARAETLTIDTGLRLTETEAEQGLPTGP